MSALHDFWVNVVGVHNPKPLNPDGSTPDAAPVAAHDAPDASAGAAAGGAGLDLGGGSRISARST